MGEKNRGQGKREAKSVAKPRKGGLRPHEQRVKDAAVQAPRA